MREIVFRGKRIDNKEWVSGFYVKAVSGKTYMITLWDNVGTWEKTPRILYVEVDSKTVGEFTGLLDKNGTKIFEGDIVKHGHTCRYSDGQTRDFYYNLLVRFSENHGAWLTGDSKYLTPRNLKKYSIEVMGNIHDSPEILEEE